MILIIDDQQLDYALNLAPTITWNSKLQLIVSLLTIEAEYRALADVAKEVA